MFKKFFKRKPPQGSANRKELEIKITVDCGDSIGKLNELANAMGRVRESAAKLREYGIKI